jgi:hypothetical protein
LRAKLRVLFLSGDPGGPFDGQGRVELTHLGGSISQLPAERTDLDGEGVQHGQDFVVTVVWFPYHSPILAYRPDSCCATHRAIAGS